MDTITDEDIKRNILNKYKPIHIQLSTKYSPYEIEQNESIRKNIATEFSKKIELDLRRIYLSGHNRDKWNKLHSATDKKEIEEWLKKDKPEPFTNLIEGQENQKNEKKENRVTLVVNTVLKPVGNIKKKKLEEGEVDNKDVGLKGKGKYIYSDDHRKISNYVNKKISGNSDFSYACEKIPKVIIADGVVTNRKDLCLGILTADCAPIVVFGKKNFRTMVK